jgi:two-component system invasion response regulator UvrY
VINILIADDHTIVREGLKQIVAEIPDMVVAGEASTGKEVLEKIKDNIFDCLVLDFSMPDKNGMEILKTVKKENPNIPVLILSIHPENQYAVPLIKAGASGYLTKESASEELIKAIRQISDGKKYLTSTLAEKLKK